jgi:PAS domain S-box-containing protein
MAESINDAIFEIDHQGMVLRLSPTGKDIWSGDQEDIIGKNFIELVHPDDRGLLTQRFLELSTGVEYSLIYRIKNKSGEIRWVRTRTRPRIENGVFIGAIGTLIDVTAQKQLEEELRENEIKFRAIVENIPQKIFIKDRGSRYVSVNENFANDLGIRPGEVRGKSDYDFFPKELAEKYRADDQRIMHTNRTEHLDEKYIQDGYEVWIHTVKAPVQDEQGEITGVFGIFMDITDRKRAEEALAAESHQLTETNTAVRVLLQYREKDQKKMGRKILDNIQKLVLPHLEKLRSLKLNDVQANCLDMIAVNLQQVTSPFLQNLTACFAGFTPREIQVANMVREGKTSKEIAHLFNSSIRSVEFHRDNIRKKLSLKQKKSNLRIFLMNFSNK